MNVLPNRRGQRRIRDMLYLTGTVATLAGLHTLVAGGKSFPPYRRAGAMVESELRFYSAFYVAYGLHAFRTAAHSDPDPAEVHGIAAALFLAGLGRIAAWKAVGKPHPLQRTLLAIELAVLPLVGLEHARLRSSGLEARADFYRFPRSAISTSTSRASSSSPHATHTTLAWVQCPQGS